MTREVQDRHNSNVAGTWEPIAVEPGLREATWAAIEDIASFLLESQPPDAEPDDIGTWRRDPTLSGPAGTALFLLYLAAASDDGRLRQMAAAYLDVAVRNVAEQTLGPGLFSGFLGPAWAIAHAQSRGWADRPYDLGEVDAAVDRFLAIERRGAEFDLINGYAGIAVYCLERGDRSPYFSSWMRRLVGHLDRRSSLVPGGRAWQTPGRGAFPHARYDLGVAHGLPGPLWALGMAASVGCQAEKALELLQSAFTFLQVHRMSGVSLFPPYVVPDLRLEHSRLAWCYGDAGIGAVLYVVGREVGNEAMLNEGLGCSLAAAARAEEDSGVVDECLCHGAAGLAHVFNRMFHYTYDGRFEEASLAWLRRALAFGKQDRGFFGLGGYLRRGVWKRSRALLLGAAGVGLALLATVTRIPPGWDRALLLSGFRTSGARQPGNGAGYHGCFGSRGKVP